MTGDGERPNWCLREIFNGAAVTEFSRLSLISAFRAGLLTPNAGKGNCGGFSASNQVLGTGEWSQRVGLMP